MLFMCFMVDRAFLSSLAGWAKRHPKRNIWIPRRGSEYQSILPLTVLTIRKPEMKMFLSDNNSGVHPKIMAAVAACNSGHERPYGNDSFTQKAVGMFHTVFGSNIDICFVATGTGSNVLGLSALLRPFECVVCVDTAHINVDECGSLERFSGSKIVSVPGRNGKISAGDIVH